MEPVEPSRTIFFGFIGSLFYHKKDEQVIINRRGQQKRIEAIEDASMSGKQRTRVLDPDVALEQRLGQVAQLREQGDNQAQDQGLDRPDRAQESRLAQKRREQGRGR